MITREYILANLPKFPNMELDKASLESLAPGFKKWCKENGIVSHPNPVTGGCTIWKAEELAAIEEDEKESREVIKKLKEENEDRVIVNEAPI